MAAAGGCGGQLGLRLFVVLMQCLVLGDEVDRRARETRLSAWLMVTSSATT
ncbi:hypothetical protein ACIBH1_44865 [Nonomuraea sp. NPDC050663]|uniref:hypothetical protein n=1 Tax=Nonomuraea sp. NPDC050663 TaxID=3364370 RepID=UPI0037AC70A4